MVEMVDWNFCILLDMCLLGRDFGEKIIGFTRLLLTSLQSRWHIFNPAMLHELSQAAIAVHGQNTAGIIDHIVTNLTETYGTKHINTRQDEWVFNNAGGAMGKH